MALKILKPRQWHEDVSYCAEWSSRIDGTVQYSFPCTADGKVLVEQLSEDAQMSLRHCLANLKGPMISRSVNRWVEPALAQCVCGKGIELDCDGARCECGRIYNLSGQELMPRQFWENDW